MNGSTLPWRLVIVLASSLALTGCFEEKQAAAWRVYNQPSPLEVRTQPDQTVLPAAVLAQPVLADAHLALIADRYGRQGVGPLAIHDDDAMMAMQIQSRLVAHGVPADRLQVVPAALGQDGALVSFQAATVVPPNCGDRPWSYGTHLGCAIDAQIGMMVARPKDLVAPDETGATDSLTAAGAVDRVVRQRQPAESTGLLQHLTTMTVTQ